MFLFTNLFYSARSVLFSQIAILTLNVKENYVIERGKTYLLSIDHIGTGCLKDVYDAFRERCRMYRMRSEENAKVCIGCLNNTFCQNILRESDPKYRSCARKALIPSTVISSRPCWCRTREHQPEILIL